MHVTIIVSAVPSSCHIPLGFCSPEILICRKEATVHEILVVVLKMERALRTGVRSPMMLGARRGMSGGGVRRWITTGWWLCRDRGIDSGAWRGRS